MNEFVNTKNYSTPWSELIGHLYQLEVKISAEDQKKIQEIVKKHDATYTEWL